MLLSSPSEISSVSQKCITFTGVICHYAHVRLVFSVHETSGTIRPSGILPDTAFAGKIGRLRSPAYDLYHDTLQTQRFEMRAMRPFKMSAFVQEIEVQVR